MALSKTAYDSVADAQTDGVIHYWDFDETTGDTFADGIGPLDGAIIGDNSGVHVEGFNGKGLAYNINSSTPSLAIVSDPANSTELNDWTFYLRVKLTSLSIGGTVRFLEFSNSTGFSLDLYNDAGVHKLIFTWGASTATLSNVDTEKFQNIVIRYQYAGQVEISLDDSITAANSIWPTPQTLKMYIDAIKLSSFFASSDTGLIIYDEMAVYNRRLLVDLDFFIHPDFNQPPLINPKTAIPIGGYPDTRAAFRDGLKRYFPSNEALAADERIEYIYESEVQADGTNGTDDLVVGKFGNARKSLAWRENHFTILAPPEAIELKDYSFSLSCWFRIDAINGYSSQTILQVASGVIELYASTDGHLHARYFPGVTTFDFGAVTVGQWYHYAYSYDGETCKQWLDGVLVNTSTDTGVAHNFNYVYVLSRYSRATIDDVAVWGRKALAQSDVDSLYNSGTGAQVVNPAGLTLLQDFGFSLPISISIYKDTAAFSLPLSVDVVKVSGATSLPFTLNIVQPAAFSLPIAINVHEDQLSDSWSFSVVVGGDDLSNSIVGSIRVEAEEDSSRIAEFNILPDVGVYDGFNWVGKSVEITYYDPVNNINAFIFRGVVDVPEYDISSGLISFICSDQLQERLERSTIDQIDDDIPGYYHSAVFGDFTTGLAYSQAKLSTIAASYDLDVNGFGNLGYWDASTPDFIIADDQIIADSVSVSLNSRRDLVNSVNLTFDFRFTNFRERRSSYDWNYWRIRDFYDYSEQPSTLPNNDLIESAISSTGWDIIGSIRYERLPVSQEIRTNGKTISWSIGEELRNYIAVAANFTLGARWEQVATRTYNITIKDSASVAAVGEIKSTDSFSIENSIDAANWTNFNGELPDSLTTETILTDVIIKDNSTTELDLLFQCAANKAKSEILSTHRQNIVSFSMLLNPFIERHHVIDMTSIKVDATGKARRITHELNVDTGAAITSIELAIFRTNSANTNNDAFLLPEFSETFTAEHAGNSLGTYLGAGDGVVAAQRDDWRGWIGNYDPGVVANNYEEQFTIDAHEVESGAVDPIENEIQASFDITIPNHNLIIRT